ncbi:MAG: hypothetical protein ACKV22_27805, partial [Bryobacteraceae bacterium]
MEVTASPALVNLSTSEVSGVVDSRKIVAMPLLGRDYLSLATLLPGTNSGPPGDARQSGGGIYGGVDTSQGVSRGTVAASGAQPDQNRFYVDGIDNTDFFQRNPIARPSVDAVQEFQVQLSLPSAEYAGAGGGVISATTKSGTNTLHGAAWDFFRNDVLDARSFFDVRKPVRRRNQYGGVVGGPVFLPKLYNGRNRSFFLFNYEGIRFRSQVTSIVTVPIPEYRSGDFSNSPNTVYDPLSVNEDGLRTPFSGNRVPDARINPIARRLTTLHPLPTGPGLANNLRAAIAQVNNVDDYLGRFDHHFHESDRLFVRFTYSDDKIPGDGLVKSAVTDRQLSSRTGGLGTRPKINRQSRACRRTDTISGCGCDSDEPFAQTGESLEACFV